MPLQPFKATVPQDGKSWWLRLGKENLPDKFIFTLLLDMQPEHFLHRMQDVQILSQFGEYTVYSGVFEGERLGLLYHGRGSFSVSTAIDELAMLGAKAILRVGNSGGMRSDLRVGDIVVCSGGIREDRVTLDYVPLEYPAIPSRKMVQAEIEACESLGVAYKEGLTLSAGTMYPGSGFETARGVLDQSVLDRVHLWKKVGAANVDIETTTVLTMTRLYDMHGGALLGIGNDTSSGEGEFLDEAALCLADALDDDLLGGLGSDAPEVLGAHVDVYQVAQLSVLVDLARGVERNFGGRREHVVDDLFLHIHLEVSVFDLDEYVIGIAFLVFFIRRDQRLRDLVDHVLLRDAALFFQLRQRRKNFSVHVFCTPP